MIRRRVALPLTLFLACTVLGARPARAQDSVPPQWQRAYGFLIANVCIGRDGRVLPGASPLDGPGLCPAQRKIAPGERLPYHKRDWTPADVAGNGPNGYQQSDSFPVRTALGLAVVQTYDFGDPSRAYGRFDEGDGGQVAFFSPDTVSFGITEDGGAGMQLFIGPGCMTQDSWVIVDNSFAARQTGETLARITRQMSRCPQRLGYAYTRWWVQPIRYRFKARGRPGTTELSTLVSEHFGGQTVERSEHLERFQFTQELGYTRWERWQNLAVRDRPEERRLAQALAGSNRCEPGLGAPPGSGNWILVDCRQWTIAVPPTDPAGDPPEFWMDRLRQHEMTRALFPP